MDSKRVKEIEKMLGEITYKGVVSGDNEHPVLYEMPEIGDDQFVHCEDEDFVAQSPQIVRELLEKTRNHDKALQALSLSVGDMECYCSDPQEGTSDPEVCTHCATQGLLAGTKWEPNCE